ncbi:MAG TPA: amidohydrolase [Nocardioidaceae bacterium]|nr:amidohydrolase [Nocardioidaceae bacterium]
MTTSTIFRNGHVFDGDRYLPDTAVAVRDGRVVAVGEDADVRDAAGAGADEVDLAGRLLTPGFQDAHMHPMVAGLERLRCDLTTGSSREEYLDLIARFAADHPEAAWIRGGGWSAAVFGRNGPSRQDLDAIVPNRPVFLPSSDHHDAWVNTKALEIAGIDASTRDPQDGWFVRDHSGMPTGAVREAASLLVQRHVTTTREEYLAGLLEAQRFLHSHGITGWQDALLGGYANLDDPTPAYLDAIAAGKLTARVRGALWWDRHRGPEQAAELAARRDELAALGLDTGSVKMMMDGIPETLTAAVTEPYVNPASCPCGDRGLAFLDPDEVKDAVTAADAAGFQVHVHAIGDRAVTMALDGMQAARERNGEGGDHRHQIAHLQLVRPADRPRFGRLGVTANIQGYWAQSQAPGTRTFLPFLDEERAGWHYPFADIAAGGAALAGGSDWPISTPDPIQAVHVTVNRSGYSPDGAPAEPLVADQGLDLRQAMAAYTSGSARVNHRDDTGRIASGTAADLAVVDTDVFALPADRIGSASVVATYVAGECVFSKP